MTCTPPPSLPRDHHSIVATPDTGFSVDGSDYALGVLRYVPGSEEYFRVAQVGFAIRKTRLQIVNLQGSGPHQKYHAHGLNTQAFYRHLQRAFSGMKPINALLGIVAVLAKEDPRFTRLFFDPNGSERHSLNYHTVLQALHFRRNARGIFELDLSLPERKILARTTGADPEKQAVFAGVLEEFRGKLNGLFTPTLVNHAAAHAPASAPVAQDA